ncbi:hypothetical protein J7M22_07385 [Candidatus Poribacteria bacterium]|nr:hypothetical protein [Candidatus Poribacteria bacterium]
MRRFKVAFDDSVKVFVGSLLLAICPLLTLAESPWMPVHPGNPAYKFAGIEIVHFRDSHTGWAAGKDSWSGQTLLLRTTDGGLTWREELTDFPYERAFFISPLEGWTFRDRPFRGWALRAPLMEEIELYHTTDGGLSWQLQKGKIVNLAYISKIEPEEPFEYRVLTKVYFLDSQRGWLLGFVNSDKGVRGKNIAEWVAGNLFLFTNDGGRTWRGRIDVYPTGLVWHDPGGISFGAPEDIDFVNHKDGWILAATRWIYRTSDGGRTWKRLETGYPPGFIMKDIDFVDTRHGWIVGNNVVLFTQDGGRTWTNRSPDHDRCTYELLYFTSAGEGWVAGYKSAPHQWKYWILHTADGGKTWKIEWEHNDWISYLGYDLATRVLWVGGQPGILLKRAVKVVTPRGKLPTSWGKIKIRAS